MGGAHARKDYHKRDDVNWLKHNYAWRDAGWNVHFTPTPLHSDVDSDAPSTFGKVSA